MSFGFLGRSTHHKTEPNAHMNYIVNPMVRIPVLSDEQLLPPCGVWSPGEQADFKKQVRE
jgi:hypothetical protein